MIQQKKRNKENFQISKDNKSEMIRQYHKRSLTCFVIGWNIDSKVLIGRVRQATKDVVKSEV